MSIRIVIGATALSALLGCCFIASVPSPASAQPAMACPKGYTFARGTGCVKNSIVEQAKKNCKNGPARSNDWPQCICSDAGRIGACGN